MTFSFVLQTYLNILLQKLKIKNTSHKQYSNREKFSLSINVKYEDA